MPRYEQRDVSFDVPRHWDDKTLVAFAAPAQPGQALAPNLVMTRDQLGDADTLDSYADKQLAELAGRVEGFELVKREHTSLGGAPAIALRFRARADKGTIEQRLVLAQGRRRGVFCFTATMSKADAEQYGPLFDRMLGSVRFAGPSAPDEGGAR